MNEEVLDYPLEAIAHILIIYLGKLLVVYLTNLDSVGYECFSILCPVLKHLFKKK